MSNVILTPDQLQSGLKPSLYDYHIDTRNGNAIILLPTNKNQERPSVDVPLGCSLTINDLYGCFDCGVEVRAPNGGTVDGKPRIFISENYANVKFTLVDELTWLSTTTFTNSKRYDLESDEEITLRLCDLDLLITYNFDITFDTKYKTENINIIVTKNGEYENLHVGEDLIEYSIRNEDGVLYLSVNTIHNGILDIRTNSVLRK